MKYKEKFLELLDFFVKSKTLEGYVDNFSKDRNGKYVKSLTDGTKIIVWYKDGLLHREHGPAFIKKTDSYVITKCYKNGVLHRDDDEPTIVSQTKEGKWSKEWYKNGVLHRDNDKPAIINSEKEMHWYQDGYLHREGDKPSIESLQSHKWCKHGKVHRDNGPAVLGIKNFYEHWYKDGVLHREDGPAIKSPQVKGFYRDPGEQWWINGKELTQEEFNKFKSYKNLDKELPKNDKPQNKKLKI